MAINVKSEIGRLQTVLLHRPGSELEQLAPNSMARLLFDDIPYLRGAQAEHDCFADVLRERGVKVLYLSELMAQTISRSSALRRQFVDDFIHRSGCVADSYREALTELLLSIPDDRELVLKTRVGVRFDELPQHLGRSLASLRSDRTHFILEPIPNLYFTRDPFACIGNGVSLHHMYSVTRNRETIYGDYILHYHPDFAGQVTAPDELLLVPMDATLMEQVLLNLLENAAIHGGNVTQIRVCLSREGTNACFSVFLSSAENGSSRIRIGLSWHSVRANARRFA